MVSLFGFHPLSELSSYHFCLFVWSLRTFLVWSVLKSQVDDHKPAHYEEDDVTGMDLHHSGLGPDEEVMKNKDKLRAYIDLNGKGRLHCT